MHDHTLRRLHDDRHALRKARIMIFGFFMQALSCEASRKRPDEGKVLMIINNYAVIQLGWVLSSCLRRVACTSATAWWLATIWYKKLRNMWPAVLGPFNPPFFFLQLNFFRKKGEEREKEERRRSWRKKKGHGSKPENEGNLEYIVEESFSFHEGYLWMSKAELCWTFDSLMYFADRPTTCFARWPPLNWQHSHNVVCTIIPIRWGHRLHCQPTGSHSNHLVSHASSSWPSASWCAIVESLQCMQDSFNRRTRWLGAQTSCIPIYEGDYPKLPNTMYDQCIGRMYNASLYFIDLEHALGWL